MSSRPRNNERKSASFASTEEACVTHSSRGGSAPSSGTGSLPAVLSAVGWAEVEAAGEAWVSPAKLLCTTTSIVG